MNELYRSFNSRCHNYLLKVDDLRGKRAEMDIWTFNRLTEGLMSDIWQNWCCFCRQLIHISCRGGASLDQKVLPPRASTFDNSWKKIGYEAKNKRHHLTAHTSFEMRFEPTWGDIDKIIDIVNFLDPINKPILVTAFGMGLDSINHLQAARNAIAHKNVETITNLRRDMILHYHITNIKNPSDLAWALKRNTTTFGFYHWIYEMRIIAKEAVKTC